MKSQLTSIGLFIFFLFINKTSFEQASPNPGIWQTFGEPLSLSQYPEIKGRLANFRWADLEISDNVWDWDAFDNDLTSRTKDGLPVIFMVYTKEDAPDWLFDKGVPKVVEKDNNGNVIGYSPYYADPLYKSYFKRMIQKVHNHVETLPASVRNKIIGVQGCYGSTGDYISYKGNVANQYYLDGQDFYSLFQEFSQYYYDEYKTASPKIYLLSNPRNQGDDEAIWVVQNCPGWLKTATLGKGYQLNDERDKYDWLYGMLNSPLQNGDFIRARSEMIGGNLSSGWWNEVPYQNMFAVMCYGIFWGLDWNNQGGPQTNDHFFDSSFTFFNKYAGQKDPAKSTNAMCALKDGLDASDGTRFSASTYGSVSRSNQQRYINIANQYAAYGAKVEDAKAATLNETDNIVAKGINDVGWNIFPGNYDRYLHQLSANETSAGYWNVTSADPNSMYGRFARGFDVANGKKALYFDVDDAFLGNTALNGKYRITIEITYLDKGTGTWKLYYDSKTGNDIVATSVTCKNTNKWKKATVTLNNAYFGNRGPKSSDFSIRSGSSSNVIFSIVELSRPANFANAAASQSTTVSSFKIDSASTQNGRNLVVTPNPVYDQFYVQVNNDQQIKQVIIYNQSGQAVLQKQVSGSRILLSKNEIGTTAGVYYIKVITTTTNFIGKIVIM